MRISKTVEYYSHGPKLCPYMEYECDRVYCNSHRLLWRTCETAISTQDGAGQHWYETHDCPKCVREDEQRRHIDLARNLP